MKKLKKAYLVLLTVLLAVSVCACSNTQDNEQNNNEEVETMDCDVVVAGGGVAGMVAALAAKENGAGNVILVEKLAFTGGSSALSSAFMTTANNDNFGETADTSLDAVMSVLNGIHSQSPDKTYPIQDQLENVISETGNTVDFLLSLGMTAEFTMKSTPTTAWDGKGSGMMSKLAELAEEKGIQILLECPAEEIVMKDGKAVGLKVNNQGIETVINASKVIITTGGAAWDEERLEKYMPTLANMTILQQSAVGNTGDGFAMMEEVNAQFYEGMRIMEGGLDCDSTWKKSISTRPSTADHLGFNAEGKRFSNESPATSQMLTYYMIEDGSSAFYWLFDSSNEDLNISLKAGLESGAVIYGETIADLAIALEIDADTLQATFDRYQELCEMGVDEDYGKDASKLVAYAEEGGYYAVAYYPVSWGTLGGVVTDNQGHVYDNNNEIIENLFAAGEMSNRKFFSDFYIGGNSLTTSATLARLAGETAATELN